MGKVRLLGLFLFAALAIPVCKADSISINFENLSDSTVIGSSYASLGVIFNNAVVASAGISLNDADFPPHSGTNVAIDATGPITLTFTTPVSSFLGFFTYTTNLNLTAFSASNQVLVTTNSLFAQNFVSSGNPPNELLQLSSTNAIDHVTITGDPLGSSFAMDDISFVQTTPPVPVPEPGSLYLLSIGLISIAAIIWLSRWNSLKA